MNEQLEQRLAVVLAGMNGDTDTARSALLSEVGSIRASALVALHRLNALDANTLQNGVTDSDTDVRYRVAELAAHFPDVNIVPLLTDSDVYVAEMAAWAFGERDTRSDDELTALITTATNDERPLVREAAVAALGAIGDQRGLQAILAACSDKPAVRRRAVLALAPFEGDDVDAALTRALEDRDWQVRQNAEDLLKVR
jgi:HEAT repeat protein